MSENLGSRRYSEQYITGLELIRPGKLAIFYLNPKQIDVFCFFGEGIHSNMTYQK